VAALKLIIFLRLAVVNFSLLILLSMKNTPFESLTGYAYDRLNVFHRWVGAIAWIEGAVHTLAIGLATSRLVPDQSYVLLRTENIMGIVALGAWTLSMLAFPLLKKIAYEYFYVLHLLMFPTIAVTLYLHNVHCQIPILVGVGLYALDRIIRTDRLTWHNRNAWKLQATLQPTKDGSTLVTIPRGNLDWAPGSHAFLRIPRIRRFQSHPFSIMSIEDQEEQLGACKNVQFLVKGKRGFTKLLQQEAKDQVSQGLTEKVTAYIDGPYGGTCDFNSFDHVVLMAAGAGITYILPIGMSLIRRGRVRTLDFVWSIREPSSLETIREQLLELSRHVKYGEEGTAVNLRLHITGDTSVPKIGTIQRIQTLISNQPSVPQPYDLYGSSISLPLPKQSTTPEPSYSRKYDCSVSPSIDEWSQSHRRAFSGESEMDREIEISPIQEAFASLAGDETQINRDSMQERFPRTARGSHIEEPLLTPPAIFPPVQRPQPRSTLRSNYATDDPGYQSVNTVPFAHHISTPEPEEWLSSQPGQLSHAIRSPSHSPQLSEILTTIHASTPLGQDLLKTPIPSPAPSRSQYPSPAPPSLCTKDAEKHMSQRDPLKRFYVSGRPKIRDLITDVTRTAQEYETVAVAACGVVQWTDEVRTVVADCMAGPGPSISLFCEEFGW
jgi:predicted ferric reductase